MASLQLSSLPRDILVDNILPFLSVRDFLNFSATCKSFFTLSTDEVYWRKHTTSTFRLPAQPIRKEGWRELYKNLTNAKIFTWGHNQNARLGHSYPTVDNSGGMVMYGISTPTEVPGLEHEVVVDIKAGGWSTTFLTSKGTVFSCGSLNAGRFPAVKPFRLRFPHGYPTKIAQVSSGRSHILGLSDQGRIWQWTRVQGFGKFVKFVHIDTRTNNANYFGTGRPKGTVEKVVAGWDNSAALVNGVGIVVWFTSPDPRGDPVEEEGLNPARDGTLVDGEVVPGTYLTESGSAGKTSDSLASQIGEVVDFMAGEHFLLFLTKAGHVWAVDTSGPGAVAGISPVKLPTFSAPPDQPPMSYISGSFRKFAVFNKEGLVYLGDRQTVRAALENAKQPEAAFDESQVLPKILPSLQNRQIVAISFGDYHALALTSSGKVFSWGTESAACGCLGLGVREVARRRGVDFTHRDGVLEEPTEVYFGDRAKPGKALEASPESEFFVFNIVAAGWHSGALALVPQLDKKEGDGGSRWESNSNGNERAAHHWSRASREAGHGGIVRSQPPPPGGPIEGILPSSSTTPFIRTGLALPMPGSRIMPAVTGTSATNEQEDDDGSSEFEGELEEGTGNTRVCRIG